MIDKQYSDLLKDILDNGEEITSRNSKVLRKINLTATFEYTPLISIRKTAWRSALLEWEWFMSGSNNINSLHKNVRHWWEPWAESKGQISNNYGQQFRKFKGNSYLSFKKGRCKTINDTDQIQYMIDTLKNHPNSRRNVITTWNTHDMASPDTPITNCHGSMIQVFVDSNNLVHMTMYQRSNDMILGYPHNILQYWAFLMYLANKADKIVGSFTHYIGDAHIYDSHIEVAKKIVKGVNTLGYLLETPELIYNPTSEDFKADDFSLNKKYTSVIKDKLEMIV